MVEESSPLLPPAEESIEAETDTALEPEAESGEPTPEPPSEPGFVCDCEEWMRSACRGESFYKQHKSTGKRYCVLHYPGRKKGAAFEIALNRKLGTKDFDLRGVWFPELTFFFRGRVFPADSHFDGATFAAQADFRDATFSGPAHFTEALFRKKADFRDVTFEEGARAYFSHAVFDRRADFARATLTRRTSIRQPCRTRTFVWPHSEFWPTSAGRT